MSKPLILLALVAVSVYPAPAGITNADFEPGAAVNAPAAQAEGAGTKAAQSATQAAENAPEAEPNSVPKEEPPERPARKTEGAKKVWITAYSSSPDETDDTPLITASGKVVHDGVVAANFLPFGTKVKIPELFGEKIFTVYDRMHKRKTNVVDVWMVSKYQAIQFGAAYTHIEVLN